MRPEGNGYDLPDPKSFEDIDEFADAFAVSRGSNDYSYDNSYLPKMDDTVRRVGSPEQGSVAVTSKHKKGKAVKTLALLSASAVLVTGLGVGAAVVTPGIVSVLSGTEQVTGDPKESKFGSAYEPVATDVSIPALPVDGWTRDSKTKISLAEKARPITMTNGMIAAITADGYLYVINPTTGESVFGSSLANAKGVVTYKSESGLDSVAWRSGSDIYTWSEQEGEHKYEFTEESRLYSSGSMPVVWVKGSSDVTILQSGGGKIDMTIPDGTVPVGVSNGKVLISASVRNPVWITKVSDEATEDTPVTLAAPKDGYVIRKWIGLSNGNVVVVWGTQGELAPGSPVSIAVHSVKDGSIIDTAEIDWGSVDDENMIPDQTRTKFGIGYTYFDGSTFTSADNKEIRVSSYAGDRIYAKMDNQVGEITSGTWKAFPEGTVTPSGIGVEGEAIIKMDTTAYALIQEAK